MNIFETSFRRGKFDGSRKLSNGSLLDFTHIYPMDAVFDTPEDVPEEVSERDSSLAEYGMLQNMIRCRDVQPKVPSCCY